MLEIGKGFVRRKAFISGACASREGGTVVFECVAAAG